MFLVIVKTYLAQVSFGSFPLSGTVQYCTCAILSVSIVRSCEWYPISELYRIITCTCYKGNEASPSLIPPCCSCVLGLFTSECANKKYNSVFYNFIFAHTYTQKMLHFFLWARMTSIATFRHAPHLSRVLLPVKTQAWSRYTVLNRTYCTVLTHTLSGNEPFD